MLLCTELWSPTLRDQILRGSQAKVIRDPRPLVPVARQPSVDATSYSTNGTCYLRRMLGQSRVVNSPVKLRSQLFVI